MFTFLWMIYWTKYVLSTLGTNEIISRQLQACGRWRTCSGGRWPPWRRGRGRGRSCSRSGPPCPSPRTARCLIHKRFTDCIFKNALASTNNTTPKKRDWNVQLWKKRQLYLSHNVEMQNISLTPAMFDQIIFSRWPMQAAATARARMAEPKYWSR